MSSLFHAVLYQPIYNLLVWFYNVIPGHDIGIAIILLTAAIRLALLPLSQKALHSQKALAKLQPELNALKEAHKNDRERQAKEMMALYAREKVNPMASCLPLLIQLPILIALYQVLIAGLGQGNASDLYSFVENPGKIHTIFLGMLDLALPSIPLAIIAAVSQFFQMKQLPTSRPPKEAAKNPAGKSEDTLALVNKQMLYTMPLVTFFIGMKLPGGLALYWIAMSLSQVIQQYFVFKDADKPVVHTDPA